MQWSLFIINVFNNKYKLLLNDHICYLTTIQQSMKKFVALMGDVAVAVGCCIGVGFLSGKEAQVFFGNTINVVIFAVFFFAANCAVREYCRQNNCSTVGQLSGKLVPKVQYILNFGISLCSFVCIVTVLAGVEECLSKLFFLSNLPLYAFATALIAALLLQRNMKALKYANFVSIVMAVILIIVLLFTSAEKYTDDLQVPIYKPVIYATFSVTMSLGVTTQLAVKSDKKSNVIASALASVITAALMIAIVPLCKRNADLPTLSNITNPALLAYAVITLLLAAVTGIVANAYPIAQELKSVVDDHTVCCTLIFGLALAFSMFGFDFAVKFGYLLVSAVGALIIVLSICKLFKNRYIKVRDNIKSRQPRKENRTVT